LADLRRELDNLKHSHNNAGEQNYQLNHDLDALRRQIDSISAQNQEVSCVLCIALSLLVD